MIKRPGRNTVIRTGLSRLLLRLGQAFAESGQRLLAFIQKKQMGHVAVGIVVVAAKPDSRLDIGIFPAARLVNISVIH